MPRAGGYDLNPPSTLLAVPPALRARPHTGALNFSLLPYPEGAVFGLEPLSRGGGRRLGVTSVGGWLRSRSAACGRCSEAEQGQRSAFCKRATSRAAKAGHRNPDWVKIIPRIERQSLRHRIRREASRLYRSLRSPQDVSRLRTAGAGLGSEQRFKGR